MIPTIDILIAVIAFVVSTFASTIGIGGGLILVPTFVVLAGVTPAVAAGTSLTAILISTGMATLKNFENRYVEWRISLFLAIGSMTGAYFGAGLSGTVPVFIWKLFFVIVAIYMAFNLVRATQTNLLNKLFTGLNQLPPGKIQIQDGRRISIPGLILMGLIIGLLAAMLGLGGGFLATPYLILGVRLNIKRAVSTSIFMIFLTALAGSISHISMGHFSLDLFLAASLGTLAGGFTGARLLKKFPESLIKKIFLAFLFIAILLLISR